MDSPEAIVHMVQDFGFLPFFQNEIPGFSVEEHTPPDLWFSEVPGPWEWKGPVARSGSCVYGKIFGKKAGFVSLDWLPDFANYRRDGYDFDARYEDGLAPRKDKGLYDALEQNGSMLTHQLKAFCGYGKGGASGFETVITRLQMQCYVLIADFEHRRDKNGKEYGWGVARYATVEQIVGAERATAAYDRSPTESKQRILNHLRTKLPTMEQRLLEQLIG